MSSMKKSKKAIFCGVMFFIAAVLIGLISYGIIDYSGPFRYLSVLKLKVQNPAEENQGGILFYGASNFRLWSTMEDDLAAYGYSEVVNNGFGGCEDDDLVKYAPELLFPYAPDVVFIQTGSNDYALGGLSTERVQANKVSMYNYFSRMLPDTKFVVMSGLPLPGRAEYWDSIQTVNRFIQEYCEETDNFYFIDSDPVMLNPDGTFKPEYFIHDRIHLNQVGHDAWTKQMVAMLHKMGYDPVS